MGEIRYTPIITPEAFTSMYLAEHVGLNYRVRYPTYFDKETNIWTVSLKIIIPQICECCKQYKPAIEQDGGNVRVRRNAQTQKFEFVERNIKEPEQVQGL